SHCLRRPWRWASILSRSSQRQRMPLRACWSLRPMLTLSSRGGRRREELARHPVADTRLDRAHRVLDYPECVAGCGAECPHVVLCPRAAAPAGSRSSAFADSRARPAFSLRAGAFGLPRGETGPDAADGAEARHLRLSAEARPQFRDHAACEPDHADAWHALGRRFGRPQDFVRSCDRLLGSRPDATRDRRRLRAQDSGGVPMTAPLFLQWSLNVALVVLSLSFLLTVARVVIGPTLPDRVLALDMLVAVAIGFIAVLGI